MRLISVCAAVNNGIGVTSVGDVVAVVIIIFESEAGTRLLCQRKFGRRGIGRKIEIVFSEA